MGEDIEKGFGSGDSVGPFAAADRGRTPARPGRFRAGAARMAGRRDRRVARPDIGGDGRPFHEEDQ